MPGRELRRNGQTSRSSGVLYVPAELWGRFSDVLYILYDGGSESDLMFDYRTGVDVASDYMIVQWTVKASNGAKDTATPYLLKRVEEINEHAQRPIYDMEGVSDQAVMGPRKKNTP